MTELWTAFKQACVWAGLSAVNTAGGEPVRNVFKVIADLIFAVMICGHSKRNRIAAACAFGLTVTFKLAPVAPETEVVALVAAALWSITMIAQADGSDAKETAPRSSFSEDGTWKERNHLHPFRERYLYRPAQRWIEVDRGLIAKDTRFIPVPNITPCISQNFFQRIFGLCDVSFQCAKDGKPFDPDTVMKNVKRCSAEELHGVR